MAHMMKKAEFVALVAKMQNPKLRTFRGSVYLREAADGASEVEIYRASNMREAGIECSLNQSRKYSAWMAVVVPVAEIEAAREMQIEADRAAGRPVDEEGNDIREWSGASIQAAHAEALELDRVFNNMRAAMTAAPEWVQQRERAQACRETVFFNLLDPFKRSGLVEHPSDGIYKL